MAKKEKIEMIQHPAGVVFEDDGKSVVAVKNHGCNGCIFETGNGCKRLNFACAAATRNDATDVIFIEVTPEAADAPSIASVSPVEKGVTIPAALYRKLDYLGIIPNDVRSHNVGASNYAKHLIQPWAIWLDYPELTSWDHDIIKRVLRTKYTDTRIYDYKKIIHICEERIRQIKNKGGE